jgi:hypothetical protein
LGSARGMGEEEASGTKSLQCRAYEISGASLSVKEVVGGIVRRKRRRMNENKEGMRLIMARLRCDGGGGGGGGEEERVPIGGVGGAVRVRWGIAFRRRLHSSLSLLSRLV